MHPTKKTTSGKDAAFHYAAVDRERQFKEFMLNQKAGHILPPNMPRKGLQPLRQHHRRLAKSGAQVVHDASLAWRVLCKMMPEGFQVFVHDRAVGAGDTR